jgi:hypothetical protein
MKTRSLSLPLARVNGGSWPVWRGPPMTSRALFHRVLLGVGMLSAIYAIAETIAFRHDPIGYYDEGIVTTGAHLLLWGKLAYRDFYTNYPPGIFLLLAAMFKLEGTSIAVARGLGLALHLAVGFGAGKVAGRLLGGRFSCIAAGLVLTWLVPIRMVPFAWLAGLSVALLVCEAWAWARARDRCSGYLAVGALLGAVSWFRHDLFVYFSLTLCMFGALWFVVSREHGARLRVALWIGIGALISVSLFWLPVLVSGGLEKPLGDLFLDQVRYVMPARTLPLPPVFALNPVLDSFLSLPAFLQRPFEGAVVLVLAGPLLAGAAFLLPRSSGMKNRWDAVWPAALAISVIPQMLGRTDTHHALFSVTPALLFAWLWFHGGPERHWRAVTAWPWAMLGVSLLYFPAQMPPEHHDAPQRNNPPELARASETWVSPVQAEALTFIYQHTQPGDPIYVGFTDHRWIFINDVNLYFLADRVGATRYMQFDPNVVNRDEVQRQMIVELERTRPRVAILSKISQRRNERNQSSNMGASFLDQYLGAHYQTMAESSRYVLALRKPMSVELAAQGF